MSTFRGVVCEFPSIRIDFFRRGNGLPAPLACFLSHVHSDHLLGLESLKAPFVYCSAATKEILLRLEKYPSRMNFAKGILETRRQTYRHLSKILKTIPLESPTVIELSPGREIQVTLFDANHCVGSVMFLIEGDGKAILYTGDIRAEDWWIRSLANNPVLLPYAAGIKRLDNIYLDTTFASKEKVYRNFPTKANGIVELLRKVALYPDNTTFYFHSWTFGYEYVWLALSAFLRSQIHLDSYRWSLYRALKDAAQQTTCPEADRLYGFTVGNHFKSGCLTNGADVRLHSCERGAGCTTLARTSKVITILPVVTRRDDGFDVHEMGIGGGHGDLDQVQEVDVQDHNAVEKLLELCTERIEDSQTLEKVQIMLDACSRSRRARMRLDSHINGIDFEGMEEEMKLTTVVDELVILVNRSPPTTGENSSTTNLSSSDILPDIITFPYSRHSSYFELRALVEAFKPKEVFPCTVDELNWNHKLSMAALFGDLCSGTNFQHDQEMLSQMRKRHDLNSQNSFDPPETQESDMPSCQDLSSQISIPPHDAPMTTITNDLLVSHIPSDKAYSTILSSESSMATSHKPQTPGNGNREIDSSHAEQVSPKQPATTSNDITESLIAISPPPVKRKLRESALCVEGVKPAKIKKENSVSQWAYKAAEDGGWNDFGGLTCTRSAKSQELGFSDSD